MIMPIYARRTVTGMRATNKMELTVNIFNIAALAAGLLCLRRGGPAVLYLALSLTALALVNENLIVLNAKRWWSTDRDVIYNIYSLLEMGCWFTIYWLAFPPKMRPVILLLGCATFFYSGLELLVTGSFKQFHSNSYTLYSLAVFALSLAYIARRPKVEKGIFPVAFWLCAASLCFHGVFLLNLATIMDPDYWQQQNAITIFDLLQTLATCTYYLLICTAFILFSCRQGRTRNHRALS